MKNLNSWLSLYCVRIDVPKVSAHYRFFWPKSKHLAVWACMSYSFCLELWHACAYANAKVNAYADVSWWDELIVIKSRDQIESSNRIRRYKSYCTELTYACAYANAKVNAYADVSWWDELIAIESHDQIESSNRIRLNNRIYQSSHMFTLMLMRK